MTFFDLFYRRRHTAAWVGFIIYLAYVVTILDVAGAFR